MDQLLYCQASAFRVMRACVCVCVCVYVLRVKPRVAAVAVAVAVVIDRCQNHVFCWFVRVCARLVRGRCKMSFILFPF